MKLPKCSKCNYRTMMPTYHGFKGSYHYNAAIRNASTCIPVVGTDEVSEHMHWECSLCRYSEVKHIGS